MSPHLRVLLEQAKASLWLRRWNEGQAAKRRKQVTS